MIRAAGLLLMVLVALPGAADAARTTGVRTAGRRGGSVRGQTRRRQRPAGSFLAVRSLKGKEVDDEDEKDPSGSVDDEEEEDPFVTPNQDDLEYLEHSGRNTYGGNTRVHKSSKDDKDSEFPSSSPSSQPSTRSPTKSPTVYPTPVPSKAPTSAPSSGPSSAPQATPAVEDESEESSSLSASPSTAAPSLIPSSSPSEQPVAVEEEDVSAPAEDEDTVSTSTSDLVSPFSFEDLVCQENSDTATTQTIVTSSHAHTIYYYYELVTTKTARWNGIRSLLQDSISSLLQSSLVKCKEQVLVSELLGVAPLSTEELPFSSTQCQQLSLNMDSNRETCRVVQGSVEVYLTFDSQLTDREVQDLVWNTLQDEFNSKERRLSSENERNLSSSEIIVDPSVGILGLYVLNENQVPTGAKFVAAAEASSKGSTSSKASTSTTAYIAAAVGGASFLVAVAAIVFIQKRARMGQNDRNSRSPGTKIHDISGTQLSGSASFDDRHSPRKESSLSLEMLEFVPDHPYPLNISTASPDGIPPPPPSSIGESDFESGIYTTPTTTKDYYNNAPHETSAFPPTPTSFEKTGRIRSLPNDEVDDSALQKVDPNAVSSKMTLIHAGSAPPKRNNERSPVGIEVSYFVTNKSGKEGDENDSPPPRRNQPVIRTFDENDPSFVSSRQAQSESRSRARRQRLSIDMAGEVVAHTDGKERRQLAL